LGEVMQLDFPRQEVIPFYLYLFFNISIRADELNEIYFQFLPGSLTICETEKIPMENGPDFESNRILAPGKSVNNQLL